MNEIWIAENPPTRQYSCPGCRKNVKCFRQGNSMSYLVMDADDEKKDHDCEYNGPIDNKLIGYRPPKEKKEGSL